MLRRGTFAAREGEVVARVDEAQVRERVLDLGAVVERDAAVDRVRNLRLLELGLELARHEVRAVDDGHRGVRNALLVQLAHLPRDPLRLVRRILRVAAEDARTLPAHRHEVLLDAHRVLRDEGVRDGQDLVRGAVVPVHHYRLHAREALVEVEEVLDVRAAPRIDRLVGIANDEQVAVVRDERLHELVLERVHVLELVDHHVLQALLPLAAHVGVLAEDQQRQEYEVVVVEREALLLVVDVAAEEDFADGRRVAVARAESLQGELHHLAAVSALLDRLPHLEHVARVGERAVAHGESALLVDGAQDRVDVRIVEHGEVLRVAHAVSVLAYHAGAESVERVDEPGADVAQEAADPRAHLVRGLV